MVLIALALLAAELGLRALGYGNPRIVVPSRARGYALAGDQTIAGPRGTREALNALGFRERAWPPAAGRPRVVALGHSVTYGVGVEAGQRWTEGVERSLRGAGLPEAQVLNLAVPGYTLEQMLAVHDEVARELAPDAVVVELDDFAVRPMARLGEPRRLPLGRWVRRSAVLDAWRRHAGRAGRADPVTRRVLADPGDPANAPLWDAAFGRLEALRGELAARGGRLVLLQSPRAAAVLGEPASSAWRAWCAERPGAALVDCTAPLRAAMADLVAELAARGIDPVLSQARMASLDAAELDPAGRSCFFLDDLQHLTPRGHAVVAERIAAELLAAPAAAPAPGQ